MPSRYPMPSAEKVRSTLADLLGRAVGVDRATPPDDDQPFLVADYVTDDGAAGVLLCTDSVGVAILGAALTMMPATIVDEVRRQGTLAEPSLAENFGEIANVLAQLFNSTDTPHLRWKGVYDSAGDIPEPVAALLAAPAARRDFALTVEGYGNGKLAVLVS